MQKTAPAPIQPPANFPVSWEHPDDATLFWTAERVHLPEAVTPLEFEFMKPVFEHIHVEEYEPPLRFRACLINHYFYAAAVPVAGSPEESAAQEKRYVKKINVAMGRLGEIWQNEALPEIRQFIARCDAFDLRGAPMPLLLQHLDDVVAGADRLWEIHFVVVLPAYSALSQFDDLYRDLFGGDGAFDAYRLLQGFDNKTLETGRALWELSRRALGSSKVRQLLEENTAADVMGLLEQSDEGRRFLAELRVYLDEYGQRGDKSFVIGPHPTWIDDPSPVIKNLKDYITRPESHPIAEPQRLAEEREQLIAAVRTRLEGYPRPVVEQFEFLLKAAQIGNILTEDHGFWIDYRSMYRVRRVLVEFGRRFAEAGVIQEPDDVWFLWLAELRETAQALSKLDRRRLIGERRTKFEHFRPIPSPPALGTPPPGPPPDSAFSRTFGKFFGAPPPESSEPNELRGHAGSPGSARGPARVIRSIGEADRLQKGDVLVAETTAPPWTPLFATAAAIVTDAGGVLSHCAVVAREYRIPAVVGTAIATARIRDGQLLEVDGDAGVVRIL